jgi:hypothetical protein
MDRYGFWPDGQRMDHREFKVYEFWPHHSSWVAFNTKHLLPEMWSKLTPEQQAQEEARFKWANDIREKVSACERPLWLPSVQGPVIRQARIEATAVVILPPLVLLSIGAAFIAIWRRFVKTHWLNLAQHIRTGLLRLYGVVAVPWIAWFGYRLFDALQQDDQDLASDTFWFLVIVPIGAPIVLMAVLWVIAGFRKGDPASTTNEEDDSKTGAPKRGNIKIRKLSSEPPSGISTS